MSKSDKPDLYSYHDYRQFLKDWFDYKKKSERGYSMRSVSRDAGLSAGFLPLLLSGERSLTDETLSKICKVLHLTVSDISYLKLLRDLSDSRDQEVRMKVLKKIQKFRNYRELNNKEIEVYKFLTRWYYVAIREMVALPEFKPDPEWIQARLRARVPLQEVKRALDFLTQNGYIQFKENGKAFQPEKDVNCISGVYQVVLGQYYREFFNLISDSIENVPGHERDITGYNFAISKENLPELKKILSEAMDRVIALERKQKATDSVYNVTISAIPLADLNSPKTEKANIESSKS